MFKLKFHADGSFDKYKARWVVRGFTQSVGIDFTETCVGDQTGHYANGAHDCCQQAMACQSAGHLQHVLACHLQEQVFNHQPAGFMDES
jgi:hypothetical protein